ncbi:MAG: hypothetical protein ACLQUY_27685 [Ktedonobacterales bacterium]
MTVKPSASAALAIARSDWLEEALNDEVAAEWPGGAYRRLFVDSNDEDGTTVSEYVYDEAKSEYVIYCLLRRTSHDQLRKLLRELDVVVRVSRPRSPAERAKHGKTPAAKRITVEVGNLVIQGRSVAAEVNGCLNVKNISRFVAPARTTSRMSR